jgi:hypothetical protein
MSPCKISLDEWGIKDVYVLSKGLVIIYRQRSAWQPSQTYRIHNAKEHLFSRISGLKSLQFPTLQFELFLTLCERQTVPQRGAVYGYGPREDVSPRLLHPSWGIRHSSLERWTSGNSRYIYKCLFCCYLTSFLKEQPPKAIFRFPTTMLFA